MSSNSSVEIYSKVNEVYIKTLVTQKLKNESENPIELQIFVNKNKNSIFSSFTAKIGEAIEVKSKVIQKSKAEEKYTDSISSGNAAIFVTYDSYWDRVIINMGNIPPKEEVIFISEFIQFIESADSYEFELYRNLPVFKEKNNFLENSEIKGTVEIKTRYKINKINKTVLSVKLNILEEKYTNENNCEYLIKGGFWDGRLEINDLSQDSSYTPNCIFPDYNQPIILLRISPDKKHLFCGTYSGNIIVYQFNFKEHLLSKQIKKNNHSDEITDMIANSFLNIFASVSKDGYLLLYTLPDLKLVRAIKISYFIKSKMKKNVDNLQNQEKNSIKDNIKKNKENNKDNINNQNDSNNIIEEKKSEESKEKDTIENNSIKSKIQEEDSEQEEESEFENEDEDDIYADNVFLSSSPLPCVTVYTSKIKLFITMTLNGEFVSEKKEENNSTYITCSKIIKSLTSQEFLIYGTDNGYIKIRRFPDMKFIGDNIKITNGDPIETLAVSEDNKYCFAWSKGNEIYVINDVNSE